MDSHCGEERPDLESRIAYMRSAVAGFDAKSTREIQSRDHILRELERLTDPFDREADPVHLTGSAIVIGRRGTILHLHKRLGIWIQPGGHIERAEEPWEAALRETHEETSLEVRHPADGPRLIHLDVHPAGEHLHLDLRYLVESDDCDPDPPPAESQDVGWFTIEEAIVRTDAALVEGLRRLLDMEPPT